MLLIALVILLLSGASELQPGVSWPAASSPPSGVLAGVLVSGKEGPIVEAYTSILREEGFQFRLVTEEELAGYSPEGLASEYGALLLPDGLNRKLRRGTVQILKKYVRDQGGQVLVVYDAGQGDASMAELTGVSYGFPSHEGFWYFPSVDAGVSWGITPGKLDRRGAVTGYGYGRLSFSHLKASADNARVLAYDTVWLWRRIPVLAERRYPGGGTVLYANLPLGFHKTRTDDLTPRSILRSFLIRYARLPYLMNTPGGKGGLVVNIHVDSNAHLKPLKAMLEKGVLDQRIPFSVHITAGPDTIMPGDGLGFSAADPRRGRPLVERVSHVAALGAHGGWAHDYFAYRVDRLPPGEMVSYLEQNLQTLAAISGQAIREYSAPGGNHPDWVTRWLEEQGVVAYYTAADTGSGPTRPWIGGRPSGLKIWSFPVTPYGRYAALEEFRRHFLPARKVEDWYGRLIRFTEEERLWRTVYTHAADNAYSFPILQYLSRTLLQEVAAGRLRVAPMSAVADFLNRREETTFKVQRSRAGYLVSLSNPQGLEELAVALYTGKALDLQLPPSLSAEYRNGWYYLVFRKGGQEGEIRLEAS